MCSVHHATQRRAAHDATTRGVSAGGRGSGEGIPAPPAGRAPTRRGHAGVTPFAKERRMQLPALPALPSAEPPFTSVALDAPHPAPATPDDVERRWRRQADALLEQGAPAELVDLLAESITEPTRL